MSVTLFATAPCEERKSQFYHTFDSLICHAMIEWTYLKYHSQWKHGFYFIKMVLSLGKWFRHRYWWSISTWRIIYCPVDWMAVPIGSLPESFFSNFSIIVSDKLQRFSIHTKLRLPGTRSILSLLHQGQGVAVPITPPACWSCMLRVIQTWIYYKIWCIGNQATLTLVTLSVIRWL